MEIGAWQSGLRRLCLVQSATVRRHHQGSGLPTKVTMAEIREAHLLLLGVRRIKQKQSGFLTLPAKKCHFGRVRWGGRSLVWYLDFLVPGNRRNPTPFNSLKRPSRNSSNLASDSPSVVPGEHSDWGGACRGPPL